MARGRFLLSFEEHLEVHRLRGLRRFHGVDCGEDRHDRHLVVARRAGVDARFAIDAAAAGGNRDDLSADEQILVAQHWRPGWCRPLLRVERLAVVVRVEHQRARRTRRLELTIHCRRTTGHGEQLRIREATFAEHADPGDRRCRRIANGVARERLGSESNSANSVRMAPSLA